MVLEKESLMERANAPRIRLIAFYLPQFHPIPENDSWWGKGFTEWTNVAKAKTLFAGHFQPRLPSDLGFYDLRLPEVREAQSRLAQAAGIEGFCYYHYWFAGRQLLERPLDEVVKTGSPALPFCICWANQSWSGIWHGEPGKILIEQTYPGSADDEAHFMSLLPAFRDPRYIKIAGRLSFTLFRPKERPNSQAFFDHWQRLASIHGLPGFYFIAHLFEDEREWDYRGAGYDSAVIVNNLKAYREGPESIFKKQWARANALPTLKERLSVKRQNLRNYGWYTWNRIRGILGGYFRNIVLYEDAISFFLDGIRDGEFPCVIPNWDNTARSGKRGYVLHNSSPAFFEHHLEQAARIVESRSPDTRIVFVKSWNEWAEGNYLEPDQRFGHQYLDAVSHVVACRDQVERDFRG
jgi:hypothetical protein